MTPEEIEKDIENRFTYHAPKGDQADRYKRIRNWGKSFAYIIIRDCPDSRERSLALTKIDEAVMHANAAIVRHE